MFEITKPGTAPLSLEGFEAWLKTKDPKEEYNWHSGQHCAIGQYLRTLGYKGVGDIPFKNYCFFEGGEEGEIAQGEPHTFGACLERLQAFRRETGT